MGLQPYFPLFHDSGPKTILFLFVSPWNGSPQLYSPYLHKVDFWEMFKFNLFSKYPELLGNESEKPVIYF